MREGELAGAVMAHAATLADASVRSADGTHQVMVAGSVVAVLAPDALELRLRPAVAAAALRTPDVEPSSRGPGWVRFQPAAIDGFAQDRARAWLESAVRLAAEGGHRA